MSETSTYAGTNVSGTAQTTLDRDVSSTIWHETDSRNTPIISLLGGDLYFDGKDSPQSVSPVIGKEKATEYKYDVIEKDALTREWTGGAAVADTTTTTVPMADSTGMQAGMVLRSKSAASPEVLHVITVTSSIEIECRRNIGSTSYTIPAAATFVCVGFCQKEGGGKRGIRNVVAAARTRYVQVFLITFGITKQLDNSVEVVSTKAWTEEMKQAAREHNLDKEGSFWFNANADSTTDSSGNTCYLSRGILTEIENYNSGSNVIDLNGSMTEDDFLGGVSESIFEYGPSKKILLADGHLLTKIMGFGIGKQQLQPSMTETPYGLAIGTLVSIHGILRIVHCGVMSKYLASSEAGFGLVLDPERIKYKYLENMDNRYQEGIETPGDRVKEAQYYSVCGVSVRSRSHHNIIKNMG